MIFFFMFLNFLISPMFGIVFPFLIKEVIGFDSQFFGYIMSGFTGGVLIGSLFYGKFLSEKNPYKMFRLGNYGMLSMFLVFSFLVFPSVVSFFNGPTIIFFIVLMITIIVMGIFNPILNVPIGTQFQRIVPANMRSRVFSVMGVITQGAVPIGSLVFGILLDNLKPHVMMTSVALISILSIMIFFRFLTEKNFNLATEIE